jgi:type I restriction enzyme S subunit
MSSEWPSVTLAEVTSILGDGLHGTPAYDDDGDYHFINGSNLSNGEIVITDATKRVAFTEFEKHKKDLGERTILVSINGTLGNVALYGGEKVVLGKSACYFNVLNGVDKHFVRYVVASEIFQGYISNLATGSTIKNVSLRLMRDFSFSLPPFNVQQRIAGILKCLDDRITLLRETNATLEAIAQALFKSWFVDFDPVRAKMQGRTPEGMDEATAALFPDGLEESALGLVAEGWGFKLLGDLVVPKRGQSITRSKCIEGHVPVVAGGLSPAYHHNQSNVSAPVVTVSASGANAGFARLYHEDIWASDCSYISRDQSETMFFWYCFLKLNQEKIYSMQQGAAQPHIYPSDLMRLNICVPHTSLICEIFETTVMELFVRIGQNEQQAQTLATLRDTLLPRLISGQLRLPEAAIILENA